MYIPYARGSTGGILLTNFTIKRSKNQNFRKRSPSHYFSVQCAKLWILKQFGKYVRELVSFVNLVYRNATFRFPMYDRNWWYLMLKFLVLGCYFSNFVISTSPEFSSKTLQCTCVVPVMTLIFILRISRTILIIVMPYLNAEDNPKYSASILLRSLGSCISHYHVKGNHA